MTTAPVVPKTKFQKIDQICVVVRDVRKAMKAYWETVGIGPWKLYEYGGEHLEEMSYHGKPANFKFLMALTTVGDVGFELIQPLEGDSIYQDFLDKYGEGVQHLQMVVDDIDKAMAAAEANGIPIIQFGRRHKGAGMPGFAYLDTEESLHTTFEFVQGGGGNEPLEPIESYP